MICKTTKIGHENHMTLPLLYPSEKTRGDTRGGALMTTENGLKSSCHMFVVVHLGGASAAARAARAARPPRGGWGRHTGCGCLAFRRSSGVLNLCTARTAPHSVPDPVPQRLS